MSTQDPNEKSATMQTTSRQIHKDGKKPAQKEGKHPKPEHLTSYKGPKILTSKGKSWTENDCDEMMKLDFRGWKIRNFCELKEHVLNQCKETKNLEKRFEKRFEEK